MNHPQFVKALLRPQLSSVFLVVKPSKIIFLVYPKEGLGIRV